MELQLEEEGKTSLAGNIYVGQVETLAANIKAAFVRLPEGANGYFPLSEEERVIYTCGRKSQGPLHPGDEILVQISRDAMKGKLPALTSNLNLPGRYLVLTTGNKKIGFSAKLSKEAKTLLAKWLQEEIEKPDKEYGLVVRTNAADATKEELLRELSYLKQLYEKVVVNGRHRTCFSCLYEAEPFYLATLRNTYTRNLEQIVTDQRDIYEKLAEYLKEFCPERLSALTLYEDPLLPLYKLCRLEAALEEIRQEKVWLKSGGFLVIQQTEAFVSIDVNSGKFTGKKKAEGDLPQDQPGSGQGDRQTA
ncbi:Ribonucleases G and E [gut metagenome]|uniref:Ribonucleases G and E n=1 Tax=gut metagenome TaxID=749906 RepID=J9GRX0_9ZZZZ